MPIEIVRIASWGELLNSWIAVLSVIVFFVAYMTRQEANTRQSRREIASAIQSRLQGLSELEGKLGSQRKQDIAMHNVAWRTLEKRMDELHSAQTEMARDIKSILSKRP